jgi:hypothetical protein
VGVSSEAARWALVATFCGACAGAGDPDGPREDFVGGASGSANASSESGRAHSGGEGGTNSVSGGGANSHDAGGTNAAGAGVRSGGGTSGTAAGEAGAAGSPSSSIDVTLTCDQDETYLHRVNCHASFAGDLPAACQWEVNDTLVAGATGCSQQSLEGFGSGTYRLTTSTGYATVEVIADFEQPIIETCSVQGALETWLHGTCTTDTTSVNGNPTLFRVSESDLLTASGAPFTFAWTQSTGTFSSNERLETADDFTLVVQLCEDVDGSGTLDAAETNCGADRVTGAVE